MNVNSSGNTIITGPPNGPVLFCSLASIVVCNTASGGAGRPPGAWEIGRPTLHGGPVRLRPVRATHYTSPAAILTDNVNEGGSCFQSVVVDGHDSVVTGVTWTSRGEVHTGNVHTYLYTQTLTTTREPSESSNVRDSAT